MFTYELEKVPNQSFSTSILGRSFDIRLRTFRKVLYVDIYEDETVLVGGVRAVNNVGLLPSVVERTLGGNLMFVSRIEDYPSYENFDGLTCQLVFTGSEV